MNPDDALPSNVQEREQLAKLPTECVNKDDETRPLRHVDEKGNVYNYALRPMIYSVLLILVVELLERFSFYGVYYTQTLYLTGVYNSDWNAGFTSVDAASYVSLSTAVAYTTPFVGAIIADTVLGDYQAILLGAAFLYFPALLLMALTTVPNLLGSGGFNTTALSVSVLGLWPLGTGIIKSVINVFGAKQFHPLLQSSLIESYYVNFYMSINIGALAGITILPVIAQHNVTLAYSIPVAMLGIAMILFVIGTPRYVMSKPRGDLFSKKAKATNGTISLTTVFRICVLIIPFCIAYSQMPTTFIVQGTVMTKAFGFIDAATMNTLDCLSVLCFGYLVGSHLYPTLAKHDIKIPTTYKFAIGSGFGALSIAWSLYVESMIHAAFEKDGSKISVLWQSPSYILIGIGEIFAVSSAYEVAFTASSPQTKVLASAINIFCVGGIPNILCIFLYQACQGWFRNSRGNTSIQHLEDYATANVANYFWVLFAILLGGIGINLFGPVRGFVESIENQAAELVKTPKLPRRKPNEASPLLSREAAEERFYGKTGPVLYKMGSMRAGPSLGQKDLVKSSQIKSKYIPRLYKGTNSPIPQQPNSEGGETVQSRLIHRYESA